MSTMYPEKGSNYQFFSAVLGAVVQLQETGSQDSPRNIDMRLSDDLLGIEVYIERMPVGSITLSTGDEKLAERQILCPSKIDSFRFYIDEEDNLNVVKMTYDTKWEINDFIRVLFMDCYQNEIHREDAL